MKKFTYKFLGLTWLGGMLFIGSASGQQGPTSYSATSSAATSTVNNSISGFGTTTFPSANSYTVRYGEAGASTAGLNRTVNEFVLGGQTFVRLPRASSPFDQVTVKRRPNPVVVDPQRTALFFESPTAAAPATVVASGTPLYLSSNVVTSYESALNSYIVNRGAENLFTNTNVTTGTSNVERLDLILNKGFTVKNTTTEGFLLLERGGDDTFKYAAITELDVFGNVKTLGALKTFSNTSNWSNTGINFKSTVVQKNSTDALQRPSGNVAAEEVKGTFLTMQDLGISAGTTFFGIVIFHSDVTSSMDLIGLTDIPVNSGASLDLVGGSGIFSVPTVVNNICPTLTANLTSAFTTTNLPSGTVLTWHSGFPATNANRIANPAAVSNGLYYPAYFSSSLNCYSDAGIPVRVTIINCPPLAQNDNAETFANTPVNINVRLNDSDPEGLPLNNPTIISNPANGTVQVQANGTITYTPSPAFTGTNTFQYQVCDQGSPSLCATATVTVLVKNARIVANNDVSPQQNGASGGVAINTVLANDSLSNVPVVANLVTISAVGSVPSQLTFNTSTGQVSVNPGTPAGTYGFTYKICEIANPTNCDDATVSVPVGVAPIVAVDDTNPTAINGATGGVAIANVRTNDLLNGVPVTSSNVTTTLVGTLPAQLTFNPSTGQVSVNPGAAAGTYTFTYKICEVLNPTNCDEALVSVLVGVAPILAVDDTNPTAINGATGGVAIANVRTNDLLNGAPVTSSNVTTTLVGTLPAQLTFNPSTGQVSVNPGAAAGTYTFTYKICEVLNPTNCDEALVSVLVGVAPIVAVDDTNPTAINGATGGVAIANVRTNDLLNGAPVTSSNVTTTLVGTLPAQLTFNPSTGQVSVNPGAAAGTYTFTYKICEVLNPTNCDEALVSVLVGVAPILAVDDTNPTAINGATGGVAIANVRTNDLLNGAPVTSSNVTTTLVGTLPAQLTFNPSTGQVSVNPGAAAGTYTFTYKICEVLNPTNCDEALVSVLVGVAPIVAVDDTNPTAINGATGGVAIANVRTNDLLNGAPVTSSNVTTTLVGTLPAQLTFNPSTGQVSVNPGTASGTYTFDYKICEVLNPTNCDEAKVTVQVGAAAILARPDVSIIPINGNTGGVSELVIFSNDLLNGVPFMSNQVILTSTPAGPLTMNPNGIISVAPNTLTGQYSMIYQICEVLNPTNCDTALVTVRVVAPPVAQPDIALTLINTPISGDVTLNDSDIDPNDVLSTTVLSNPTNGTVVLNSNGTYTYSPNTNFTGKDTFCYVLSDGLSTDTTCVTITVQPRPIRENNPPIAANDAVETYVNVPVSVAILGNDVDPDGDLSNSPSILLAPKNGTASVLPSGQVLYTPSTGFVGTDSLYYKICDTGIPTRCDSAWVYILIKPSILGNLPPVAVDDFNTTVQDTPVNGTVAANDYDLDNNPLTFQTVTSPAQGTVILQPNGSYQYTPNAGFTGVDTFRYKTCDVSACDTATVFITVTPALKVRLFPRVYLQGALYGILLPDTLMRDRLRELSLIPATSPYAYLSPVTPTGAVNSSVFTVTGQNAIVDWVFVELRDAQDSTIVVDSRAALLQRDGDIVDVDGVSPVDFSSAITTKSYFVSVRHRNHLGTMSKTALTMTRTGRLIDFRKTSTPTFVFNAQAINQAQVVVDQGVALWAGNGLVDNRIIYQGNENDVNAVYQKVISSPLNVFSTPFFKLRGYFVEDIDLNGEVIVQGTLNDVEYIYQNIIKNHPGNIFKVPFFIITEQLP